MRISVIGGGTVGNAVARTYMEHAEVKVYDIDKNKSTHDLRSTLGVRIDRKPDIVFVCLPTPQKSNSLECDVSYLDEFFNFKFGSANVEEEVRQLNFVLRSTVPIGTTRRLRQEHVLPNLVHSPEFLTARCAVTDAQIPARNIIGIPLESYPSYVPLLELYTKRFPGVQTLLMHSDESEAVKLFQNSFFAVKIAFFNEINQLAEKLGLDWETVRHGMLSDGRIAHSHTNVPGPDGQYGYAGMCLPKDLANLITHYNANDIKDAAYVMTGAYTRNTLIDRRRKV